MDSMYLKWLHELTTLGYDEKVVISTDHEDIIKDMFVRGLTPKQALDEYIDYVI